MADTENINKEKWEHETLRELVFTSLKEQRKARNWGIFFRLLMFSYLFVLLFWGLGWLDTEVAGGTGKHTALVDLRGEIAPDGLNNAENINNGLKKAFEDRNTAGVILRINSPGGSPVQAGSINDEIRRLRIRYPDIPLYAVVEDICASGGYYVAVAADKIFVDKASVMGSIGVLMDGFGFTGTLEKLGVERRLLTAGENKGFLDPFSPSDPAQREHAKKILAEIHQQFIQVVQDGRGDRLKDNPEVFSGMVWTGAKSVELGLADALGNADYVAREVIQAERIVDFTVQQGIAERFARRIGRVATDFLSETRFTWFMR
ncbi:S49 family peptidase [Nitrosomonas sp. H1_AOB3]|uniref:S49 family peptidase n=1 Tax=Nitrosomonas sp. H1_AOB3 TaxID=2741553 RepID=UPI0019371530|nr:S49 family peptidase [Nitrosomonas sp. H1_AOB3]QOJ10078.1 MAG: S49 family peptidase [Nitrosomonas sp. H1_AOB3]